MKMKTCLTLLLSMLFAVSLTACNGDDTSASESSSTSIEQPSESSVESVETPDLNACVFTIVTDKGNVVANAKFTLQSDSNTYTLTTNENGIISADIAAGTYAIDYDFETLPENHIPDIWTVEITAGASVSLLLKDNTPDGSAEKPFWLNGDVTELTLEVGEELYYQCRNNNVTLAINGNVAVTYNGVTYAAENGVVTITITHEIGATSVFSVKNNSKEPIVTAIETVYPLGTMMNPILLAGESGEIAAEVPQGSPLYYKWIATKDGTFTVLSYNPQNHISLQNGYAVSDATWGELSTSINCQAGDEILIAVGTIDNEATIIDFMYSI